ncbi:hypothetical protein MAR_003071 [Mya arenaria]|uniref:Uncharacterized protein n=1 Tax=Mya arenaria TaxID=6604 RepID=A0ABY7G4Z0_MYAAR|nr:hypothetical protein MAR_003071 [Mya arenaria]
MFGMLKNLKKKVPFGKKDADTLHNGDEMAGRESYEASEPSKGPLPHDNDSWCLNELPPEISLPVVSELTLRCMFLLILSQVYGTVIWNSSVIFHQNNPSCKWMVCNIRNLFI